LMKNGLRIWFVWRKIVAIIVVVIVVVGSLGFLYGSYVGVFHRVPSGPRSDYVQNAVWILNTNWVGSNPNVLENNLSSVSATLNGSRIKYAFVFVGYWNSQTSDIDYTISDETIGSTIVELHSVNVSVLAWAETLDGNLDIRKSNRQNLYDSIVKCVNKGFDGYNDDVEEYVGTHQDWIDYINGATPVLHGLSKLMTADVAYDWRQNTNPFLHVDYIVTMFYTDKSAFEDSSAVAFWQENFGQFLWNNNPPGSPVILGIMNYYGNTHPLSWQLQKLESLLNDFNHPGLEGFSLWVYEYMGTNSDDWQQWNDWIGNLQPGK
jgi:hypothetical protein